MNTAKREFVVSSGNKKIIVTARSPFQACVAAVQSKKFRELGVLMEVIDPTSTLFYVSTIRVCKEAGMWLDK